MLNESSRRKEFKEGILPNLDVLLQFSTWLTNNGRDAMRLMREAMAEAYQSWYQLAPAVSRKVWLHKILTRRFYDGFDQRSCLPGFTVAGNVDDSLIAENRLFANPALRVRSHSKRVSEPADDVKYFRAIAGLPRALRPTMILSYLEGFSNREIADLAGIPPVAVESLISRGRRLLREELFAHLVDSDLLEATAENKEATG